MKELYVAYCKSNKPITKNRGMIIPIRNITFSLYRADGRVDSFTKEIAGDDEMVQWAANSYSEVNLCGVTAQFEDKQIAIAGNVEPAVYTPTGDEVAAALADAELMNYNMRTYGCIDVPKE